VEYTKAAVLEKQRGRSWREVYEGGGVGETVKEEHLTWSVRRRRCWRSSEGASDVGCTKAAVLVY
jgi:hypothetical protein